MAARRHVKKTFVERNRVFPKGRISAVLPVVGKNLADGKYALKPILGKPLIAYTIEEALKVTHMSEVIVSTEDEEIASVAREYGAMVPFLRPRELSNPAVTMEQVLNHLLDHINSVDGDQPAMLMVLHVHSPLRSERHLTEAIHTLLLDDVDSVIGVVEDLTFHWKPGPQGLIPVGYPKRILRQDRETIYKESGGIYLVKCENVMKGQMLGARVGHIELQWDDAYRVENEQDFVIAEMILRERMGNESTGSDTGKTRITGDSSKKYISGLGEASRELYLRVSDSV
jgi:CMP-N-acetylneuraminic acid synthetase